MKKIISFIFVLLFAAGVVSVSLARDEVKEISIIAKKFDFLPKEIRVERGKPVKIYLTSIDVAHGLAIEALGVDVNFEKGEVAVLEFTPDKVGEFEMRCSVYCGGGHKAMKGKLIVAGYQDISAKELKSAMKNKDFFLMDVHTPEQKHIEGTDAFIPYNKVERYKDKLPKDKNTKIIVYCRSGPMGDDASAALYKLGYKNVYNLKGGIKAWNKIK